MFFEKKSGSLSPACSEVLTYGSHCLAKFQLTCDCFIPNFTLKYEDSENKETGSADTVVLNLHKIKQTNFFFFLGGGHLVLYARTSMFSLCICLLQFLTHKISLLFALL